MSTGDPRWFALTRTSLARDRVVALLKTMGAAVCGFILFVPLAIACYVEYSGEPFPPGMVLIPTLGSVTVVVLRFHQSLRRTRAKFLLWIASTLVAIAASVWLGYAMLVLHDLM